MKKKTDHMLATYEDGDGQWNIQLSSQSGDSWGWHSGPYRSRQAAHMAAMKISEEEGYQFDE